jgi:hypothetical protein
MRSEGEVGCKAPSCMTVNMRSLYMASASMYEKLAQAQET